MTNEKLKEHVDFLQGQLIKTQVDLQGLKLEVVKLKKQVKKSDVRITNINPDFELISRAAKCAKNHNERKHYPK
jgi:hypothetical protein